MKQSDPKLRELLVDIIEFLPDPVFVKDDQHRWVILNSRMCQLMGVSHDDLLGKSDFDFFPPEQAEVFQAKDREVFRLMKTVENEELFTDASGKTLTISTRKSPIMDREGNKYIVGSLRDITTLKNYEKKLRDSNERFRGAFQHAPHGVALVSLDGEVLKTNDAFVRMLGYSAAELVGKRFHDFTHPADLEKNLELRRKVLEGVGDVYSLEKRFLHANGELIWARLSSSLVRDEQGEPQYFISQIENITDSKKQLEEIIQARTKAENAERARSEFLANMSHEIRTPLNAVLGLSELLLNTEVTDGQRKDFLSVIQSSGKALLHLLDDIIDFSKIDARKLKVVREPYAFRRLFDELKILFLDQARKKNISLQFTIEGPVPAYCIGDQFRLRQVLINLISNAIKFTPIDGIIQASARYDLHTESLTVKILDSGFGIPDDKLADIFQAFVQADTSKTRVAGGAGLGLAISEKLVELMGGRLEVTSELHTGSAFFFTIPQPSHKDDSEVASETHGIRGELSSSKRGQKIPANGMQILVAEDNELNQMLVRAVLEREGYTVKIVANGEEAIAAYKADRFHLVLLDIQMPVMDGYEASRELTKHMLQVDQHTPILALTAHALPEHKQDCIDAGMRDVITKPIDRTSFIQSVTHHITGKKAS